MLWFISAIASRGSQGQCRSWVCMWIYRAVLHKVCAHKQHSLTGYFYSLWNLLRLQVLWKSSPLLTLGVLSVKHRTNPSWQTAMGTSFPPSGHGLRCDQKYRDLMCTCKSLLDHACRAPWNRRTYCGKYIAAILQRLLSCIFFVGSSLTPRWHRAAVLGCNE